MARSAVAHRWRCDAYSDGRSREGRPRQPGASEREPRAARGSRKNARVVDSKHIPDESHDGGQGEKLVGFLVGAMGHEWHPTSRNEAGIDGMIELRDPAKGAVNAQIILCQVKTGESYIQNETEGDFTWQAGSADLVYWENANAPVIVAVVRLATKEAWWVAIDEAFANPDARARRVVRFDKRRGRLNETAGDHLWDVVRRDRERRAVETRMVLAGPYAAVGLRDDYEAAQGALDQGLWLDAAEQWRALAARAREKRLDVRLIWPAEEQAARALEQGGRRPAAGEVWARLAAERVDNDDPEAAYNIARAMHYGISTQEFRVALTYTQAETPEAGVDALDDLRAVVKLGRGARQRQEASAALVDALIFFGIYDEAFDVADRVLGKRHDTTKKRQMALDRLDCAAELGRRLDDHWDELLEDWSRRGPLVYGVGLQRRAVAHVRAGEPAAAREVFMQSAELWALVEGGDEQVAEAALSAALVGDLAGELAPDSMPAGARRAAALARGTLLTPAARSDRLVTAGLGFLADKNRADAIKRLTLAAMIDRRAGNLFSYRRSTYLLARAYEDADEWTEALRFWLMVGAEARAAEAAPRVETGAVLTLARLRSGPPWERAASFAALEKHAMKLDCDAVSRIAGAVVAAATPGFALVAPQPSFYARRTLARICDRLPADLAEAAGEILAEDIRNGAPNAPESSRGLIELHRRDVFDAGPVILDALLGGHDLPVTIAGWLRDAGESVQRPLIDAALNGNRVALVEAAAADMPQIYPELQDSCQQVIRAAVSHEEQDASSEIVGASFVDFADLARFCSARLQSRFVGMLLRVIASPRYDEMSKTSALIAVALVARDLAPTPARRALRALLPIANGVEIHSAVSVVTDHPNPKRARTRVSRASPPAAIRSAAVQACGRLALRVAPGSRAVDEMLRQVLAANEPQVIRMALRELVSLTRLGRDVDTDVWIGHADRDVRAAAELLRRSR